MVCFRIETMPRILTGISVSDVRRSSMSGSIAGFLSDAERDPLEKLGSIQRDIPPNPALRALNYRFIKWRKSKPRTLLRD
jgi:hypothetical protein